MTFDTTYLQTLDGENKEHKPAKAIAANARKYIKFTPATTPAYMALLNFQSLQKYFMHLKSTMKFCATTVAEKIRSLRHAIDYVMYEHSDERSFTFKYIKVKDRLKNGVLHSPRY